MYLNMTKETCTGTGDVLTLAGAVGDFNAFGKTGNAVDGEEYSCVLVDANETTVTAGDYVFNKAAGTITRNDNWNSTASAVDRNPSSNITLSGGTHTIMCVTSEENVDQVFNIVLKGLLQEYPGVAGTSGAEYTADRLVNVNPSANSTQKYSLSRNRITFDSDNNIVSGGWLNSGMDIIDTSGIGVIDKVVGRFGQFSFTGGDVTTAISFEATIGTLAAETLVGNYVANLLPDLSAVPNIGNVGQIWSSSCLHYDSKSLNAGQTMQSMNPLQGSSILQELAPVHAGVAAGRYYLPYSSTGALTSAVIVAGVRYYIPFNVPERTTYTKIGMRITAGVASSNIRMGIHHSQNGVATNLIVDTGDVSTAAAGIAEATINEPLEAGFYWLTFQASAAISVNHVLIAQMSTLTGSTTDNGAEISPFAGPVAYGVLPSVAAGIGYSTTDILPAMWLRK